MNVTTKRMTELHTGFLSPTGEFFPCGYMEHMEIADDILYSLFPGQEFLDPEEEYLVLAEHFKGNIIDNAIDVTLDKRIFILLALLRAFVA